MGRRYKDSGKLDNVAQRPWYHTRRTRPMSRRLALKMGKLTQYGQKMMAIAEEAVRTGDFPGAVRTVYRRYNPGIKEASIRDKVAKHRLYNVELWIEIRRRIQSLMAEAGITKDNIVRRIDSLLDTLDEKLKLEDRAEGIAAIAKEMRELLLVIGGSWAGLDQSHQTQISIGGQFNLIPSRHVQRKIDTAEEAEEVIEEGD